MICVNIYINICVLICRIQKKITRTYTYILRLDFFSPFLYLSGTVVFHSVLTEYYCYGFIKPVIIMLIKEKRIQGEVIKEE